MTNNKDTNSSWDIIIGSKSKFKSSAFLKDLINYRELINQLVKRDFVATYKQTILGPIWYFLQPLFSTALYLIVFNKTAKIPTDGIPPILFYLCGLALWNYFANCFTKVSTTFITNSNVFGKVYFPRIIIPITVVISNLVTFAIQLLLLFIFYFYYSYKGMPINISINIFWIIPIVLIMALLGLGAGIIISSLTTKYRDLTILITFGVQLLMFATPVVYPLSFLNKNGSFNFKINPLSSLFEIFRSAIFNNNTIQIEDFLYSTIITIFTLGIGLFIFNRVEKSFMDSV